LQYKLVDEVGGEQEVVQWLEGRGVDKNLKVVDWKQGRGVDWPIGGALAGLVRELTGQVGSELAGFLARHPALRTFTLDGLLSVWQPSEN
jgi:protease-4